MLHLITALIIGAIFGVVTAKVTRFRISSEAKGLGLGIGGNTDVGNFFMPMMLALMAPMIPSSQMGLMVAGSFFAHLLYGLVLGGIVGVLLPRQAGASTCRTCGAPSAAGKNS